MTARCKILTTRIMIQCKIAVQYVDILWLKWNIIELLMGENRFYVNLAVNRVLRL